jgi:hypothetical protein
VFFGLVVFWVFFGVVGGGVFVFEFVFFFVLWCGFFGLLLGFGVVFVGFFVLVGGGFFFFFFFFFFFVVFFFLFFFFFFSFFFFFFLGHTLFLCFFLSK